MLVEMDRECYEKVMTCLWRWTGHAMKKSHRVSGGGQGVLLKSHAVLVALDRECCEKVTPC